MLSLPNPLCWVEVNGWEGTCWLVSLWCSVISPLRRSTKHQSPACQLTGGKKGFFPKNQIPFLSGCSDRSCPGQVTWTNMQAHVWVEARSCDHYSSICVGGHVTTNELNGISVEAVTWPQKYICVGRTIGFQDHYDLWWRDVMLKFCCWN